MNSFWKKFQQKAEKFETKERNLTSLFPQELLFCLFRFMDGTGATLEASAYQREKWKATSDEPQYIKAC